MNKKKIMIVFLVLIILVSGCGKGKDDSRVIIYTNSDDEAVQAMKKALDRHGYKGKYTIQSLGTSELGGKMVTEGNRIEGDMITQASYFIDNAQKQTRMFQKLPQTKKPIESSPNYRTPLLRNVGSMFINTKQLEKEGLKPPKTTKDLTKPEYKDKIAIPSIMGSSTGWLLIQAILNEYGDKKGQEILNKLIDNAGPHLEASGSGPLKKVQTGEVVAGFGLRGQALDAKEKGLPIKTVDPKEGNFSLKESIGIVKKDNISKKKQQRMEGMLKVIQQDARKELIHQYPVPVYQGEHVSKKEQPKYLKQWKDPLDVDLLKQHQQKYKEANQN